MYVVVSYRLKYVALARQESLLNTTGNTRAHTLFDQATGQEAEAGTTLSLVCEAENYFTLYTLIEMITPFLPKRVERETRERRLIFTSCRFSLFVVVVVGLGCDDDTQ